MTKCLKSYKGGSRRRAVNSVFAALPFSHVRFIFRALVIDNMPTVTINDLYKELKRMEKEMITKSDLDNFTEQWN